MMILKYVCVSQNRYDLTYDKKTHAIDATLVAMLLTLAADKSPGARETLLEMLDDLEEEEDLGYPFNELFTQYPVKDFIRHLSTTGYVADGWDEGSHGLCLFDKTKELRAEIRKLEADMMLGGL